MSDISDNWRYEDYDDECNIIAEKNLRALSDVDLKGLVKTNRKCNKRNCYSDLVDKICESKFPLTIKQKTVLVLDLLKAENRLSETFSEYN